MREPSFDPAVTPDAFRRARAIFESALDWPPTERARLVREACGEDTALLADVQRMLRADAEPHALLDGVAALPIDRWRPGDTFAAHYRIVSLLGRGGMGEVYRGHDVLLGRDVALKVLPAHVTSSQDGWAEDRLARLQREAQVLAGLNHPNIASIHGLEEQDGIRALVLELVEGPTLADRIGDRPVPIEEAIGIARQIAVALEAAHEQGVVHRDLKPANVKLRPDGTVKVLDFGLAKVVQPVAAVDGTSTASPTITSPSLQQRGVLLGTAAYMSPEQAKGREADRRSDIWAFGAVLYEMLSGSRAFHGDDISETLAAVLRAGVDWSRVPPTTPPTLRQLAARCLERDPKRRLQDIGEARIVLEDFADGVDAAPSSGEPASAAPRWRRFVAPIAAAIAAGTVVAMVLRPAPNAPAAVTRFTLSMSAANSLRVDPQSRDLTITADGRIVVYKGGGAGIDRDQLFTYALDQLEPRPLTDVGLPKGPFASPDGQWIGFFEPGSAGAVFKKVAITGGPALEVSRLDGPSRGATWGDDNTIIAASGSPVTGLLRLAAAGGNLEVLTRPAREKGESDHLWPQFLPGNKAVLFTVTSLTGDVDAAQVAVLELSSGTITTLLRGASQAQYVRSGHLVYVAGGALWAVGFDPARLEMVGQPTVVVPQIVVLPTGTAEFDVARDGTLVYLAKAGMAAGPRTLVWVDREGREENIAAPARPYANVRLSPDGTRAAVEIEDQEQDIWVWHFARETLTRVTKDPGLDESPVWMPDGRRLIFTSQAGGVLGSLFSQAADGTGVAERLTESRLTQRASDVLADGTQLLFSEGNAVWAVRLGEDRSVRALIGPPSNGGYGVVSPDGRWLAYVSIDSGSPQVYVSPFPNPDEFRLQISPDGGSQPRWTLQGRELVFTSRDGTLMSVPVTPGSTFAPGTAARVLERPFYRAYYSGLAVLSRAGTYDVTPDGRRFLMLREAATPGQTPESPSVVVVRNWSEELKRLVPAER